MRPKTPAAAEFEALAKIAKQSGKLERVKTHLRRMEVTLNHNISQFFFLAPDSHRNDLLAELFGHKFEGFFEMENRDVDKKFALANCMQPDLLFISKNSVVSIEMKVRSKCSVDQVLKYALLGLAVEIKEKQQKEHYLVLLGPGTLASQFREPFDSIESLRDAICREELTSFLRNKPRGLREQERKERLQQIVHGMHVQFLNYAGLTSFLRSSVPPPTDQSAGAEVYRKLIYACVTRSTAAGILCDDVGSARCIACVG